MECVAGGVVLHVSHSLETSSIQLTLDMGFVIIDGGDSFHVGGVVINKQLTMQVVEGRFKSLPKRDLANWYLLLLPFMLWGEVIVCNFFQYERYFFFSMRSFTTPLTGLIL